MKHLVKRAKLNSARILVTGWAIVLPLIPLSTVLATSAGIAKKSPALRANSAGATSGLQSRSIRIRKQVEKNQVDGLVIGVHQVNGLNDENPRLVSPNDIFRDGDRLRISLESNFNGYVYLVNVAPDGTKYLSFPSREAKDNRNQINTGATIWMPPQDPLTFDNAKGVEVLRVIVSKDPISFYEEGYKNWPDGRIPESENQKESIKGNTRGVIVKDKVVIPAPMKGKILARKIELAPPDKNSKEAVIAIPKDKSSDGKMNDHPVVFEIRLQHN
jgi:hypothetical protein